MLLIVDMFNEKAKESQVLHQEDVCFSFYAVDSSVATIGVGKAFQLLQQREGGAPYPPSAVVVGCPKARSAEKEVQPRLTS